MEIVFCGNCGFIGENGELISSPPNNGKYDSIIRASDFYCRCCPKCKSTIIFYKSSHTITITHNNTPPSACVPSVFGPTNTPAFPASIPLALSKNNISMAVSKIDDSRLPGYDYPPPSIERGQTPVEKPQEEPIDPDILNAVLDSVIAPSNIVAVEASNLPIEEPKKKESTPKGKKEIVQPNRVENTKIKKSFKCDLCAKDFSSRVDGSTRCQECMIATQKRLIG